VSFLAGQGQFRQAEDEFELDVSRFTEQQRQFNVNTQLAQQELVQRGRLAQFEAALALARDRQQQLATERRDVFDAFVQRQRDVADFQQQQQLIGQEFAGRERLDRFGHLQDVELQRQRGLFAQREAEFDALRRARPNMHDEAQWAQVVDQFNQKWGGVGLPPVGADIFGPTPVDPLVQAQQQTEAMNQVNFGGNPLAFVQPTSGDIDFLPYDKTPAGMAQHHRERLETETEKRRYDAEVAAAANAATLRAQRAQTYSRVYSEVLRALVPPGSELAPGQVTPEIQAAAAEAAASAVRGFDEGFLDQRLEQNNGAVGGAVGQPRNAAGRLSEQRTQADVDALMKEFDFKTPLATDRDRQTIRTALAQGLPYIDRWSEGVLALPDGMVFIGPDFSIYIMDERFRQEMAFTIQLNKSATFGE
jgi:hypothetical protein